MRDKMNFHHFRNLRPSDYIKFVIKDETDFKDAVSVIKRFDKQSASHPRFAFSPVHGNGNLKPELLVKRMYQEKACIENNAILNLQLHKYIGVS